MHKALAMPAATLAALLLFGAPDGADARSRAAGKNAGASSKVQRSARGSKSPARVSGAHGRRKPAPAVVRGRKTRGRQRAEVATGVRPRTKRSAPATLSAHGRRGSGKRVIRQNPFGEVVLDRAEIALASSSIAGPSRELYNYPPSPCDPVDVVLEAHVHEWQPPVPGSPTADLVEEADRAADITAAPARTGARASLTRIAAKVGSLFRPKSGESEVRPQDVDLTDLVSQDFLIPVEGVDAQKLRDSFLASRGRHAKHLAIDIGAPRGTPILATIDGEIVKTAKERRGGNAIYQKDASGQYLLFYCHLARYAEDIEPGRQVRKGDVIGYVGSTGHVIGGAHLHFSITRLPEDDGNFRKGLAINPYLIFLAGVP